MRMLMVGVMGMVMLGVSLVWEKADAGAGRWRQLMHCLAGDAPAFCRLVAIGANV